MTLNTAEHVETAPPERKKRKARWNMDATMRHAALVQMAMVVADKKSSHAAACKASAVLLRADVQNQKDEEYRRKNKHRYPKQIVVEFTRDFYNNNAHELAAARAAAEASADFGVAGTKEDRDLRPEASGSKGTTVFATLGTKEKHDLQPEVKQDAGKAGGLGPQSRYATGPPGRRG